MNQDENKTEQEVPSNVVDIKDAEKEVAHEVTDEQQETPAEEALPTVEELTAEIEKMKEQVLRAMAESENTRRRMTKELQEAQKYSVSKFAKEMLTVSDNFRRALDAVPADKTQDETLKNLMDGVEATERQLVSTLERFGISKIETKDKPFDPHLHQVMMEQEDPSKPAGMVLQVLQEGYMIHDRLLREAMVVVAKGGPAVKKVDTEA